MRPRLLFQILAVATLFLGVPAQAQEAIVLVLQHRIISERRLADDRETTLLRAQESQRLDLERDLEAARKRGAAARNDVKALASRLDVAVKKERALLAQILSRDPASKLMVQDLQAELGQLSASASSGTKSAIAQFGRGDRLGAWPKIEALSKKGTPRDKRVAARLRTIMFNFQDRGVTAEDVRAQWLEASKADPKNALALSSLATAQQYLGDTPAALETLEKAKANTKSPTERLAIMTQMGAVAWVLQKPELMVTVVREQLEAINSLEGDGTSDPTRNWMVAQTKVSLGGYLMVTGKNAEAVENYTQAAETLDRLRTEAPTWRFVDDALASTMTAKGNAETQLNRMNDALASYGRAIDLLEERVAKQPGDAAVATVALMQALAARCAIYTHRGEIENALRSCQRGLELQKAHPQSAARDFTLAGNAAHVGRLLAITKKMDEARATLEYSVELWRSLVALDGAPANVAGYAAAYHELAQIHDEVCWRDVAAAWKSLQGVAPLNDQQKRLYLRARINGRAGLGCDLEPPPANHNDD